MGNPRAFYYACTLTASLLLTACDDTPQRWRESEIQDIARQVSPQPYGGPASNDDITALQEEVTALKAEVDRLHESNRLGMDADTLTNDRIDNASQRIDAVEAYLYQ